MKKIIDFEIILILVLVILFGTVYFVYSKMNDEFKGYEKIFYSVELRENEIVDVIVNFENDYLKVLVYDFTNEKRDIIFNKSYKDILIEVSFYIFIVVNIISFCYQIIRFILHKKSSLDYEKEMKKEQEYNHENSKELPEYNALIARAILYKYIYIEQIIITIKKYFRDINVLDENNKIIESNLYELDDLEKEILEESQKKYLERNYSIIESHVYDKLKELDMIEHKPLVEFLSNFFYLDKNDDEDAEFFGIKFKRNIKLIISFVLILFILRIMIRFNKLLCYNYYFSTFNTFFCV